MAVSEEARRWYGAEMQRILTSVRNVETRIDRMLVETEAEGRL